MPDLKFGRLPGQIPVGLHELGHYVAGSLPRPPASISVPAVSDWMILGNDAYGDCGVAGLEHGFMADASATSVAEAFPGDQQAIDYYLNYTGGQDTGVVLSQYLSYVRQHGYYGHTVSAYAPVEVRDVPMMQSAVSLFDFAYCGIVVTQGMMDAFQAGEPWLLASLNSQVLGRHCVPVVGYSDHGIDLITWGRVQHVSYPAWYWMVEEAWAVMAGELDHGDGRGINYDALLGDLGELAA